MLMAHPPKDRHGTSLNFMEPKDGVGRVGIWFWLSGMYVDLRWFHSSLNIRMYREMDGNSLWSTKLYRCGHPFINTQLQCIYIFLIIIIIYIYNYIYISSWRLVNCPLFLLCDSHPRPDLVPSIASCDFAAVLLRAIQAHGARHRRFCCPPISINNIQKIIWVHHG